MEQSFVNSFDIHGYYYNSIHSLNIFYHASVYICFPPSKLCNIVTLNRELEKLKRKMESIRQGDCPNEGLLTKTTLIKAIKKADSSL